MLVALAVVYAGGWSWLTQFVGPEQAFVVGIAPFVIADVVKVAIGAALLPYAERLLARVR
jgi:biotin transport system substrate-specific component